MRRGFLPFRFALVLILQYTLCHGAPDKARMESEAKAWRNTIPLNPGLQSNPQEPILVAVAHGGRILVSRDDGQSWEQVFYVAPGSDHSPWSCKTVTYDDGLFVTALGWGAPVAWLASVDGKNWTHLTQGGAGPVAQDDPTLMSGTWGLAAGNGHIVSGASRTFSSTSDQGKTWDTFSITKFADRDSRPRLSTHHVAPLYLGDQTGRFLALGDDRSKETNYFGHLYASDDGGATWRWLNPEKLYEEVEKNGRGKAMLTSNGAWVLLVQNDGSKAWRSQDGGETWEGPFPTGATGYPTLSLVGDQFWLVGDRSRVSIDGENWIDLPENMPKGKLLATDKGTLISYHAQRNNLMRSGDGGKTWEIVHEYEAENLGGAPGVRDAVFGFAAPVQ